MPLTQTEIYPNAKINFGDKTVTVHDVGATTTKVVTEDGIVVEILSEVVNEKGAVYEAPEPEPEPAPTPAPTITDPLNPHQSTP